MPYRHQAKRFMIIRQCQNLLHLAVIESEWPEVVRLGDEMIAVNPLFTLGHYYRGYALLQQDRIELAEQSLRIALSTPDQRRFPDVHYALGEVLRRRALFSSAALEYRLYAEVAPDGEWAEKAREWLREWANLGLISADQAEVR